MSTTEGSVMSPSDLLLLSAVDAVLPAFSGCFKGQLLCKIHFFMSFIHKHVSPLCKEILKVSGTKICSLFVLIHLYKNLSENELIRFWPLYDVIRIFLACVTISQ